MKILSVEQMTSWERYSRQKRGVSAKLLMKRAAAACVREILGILESSHATISIVIVSGPGNNGGDGFAIAQELDHLGYPVECFFLGKVEALSPEAVFFLGQTKVHFLKKKSDFNLLRKKLRQASLVVDALFGIGLNRPIRGIFAEVLAWMNSSPAKKIAVDIPSGIDGNSGEVLGLAFQADKTVTFELPKRGHLADAALNYVGELRIASIGLSQARLKTINSKAEWVDEDFIKDLLPRRKLTAHKGEGGKALILAGSPKMPGAGYLSALAALRSGVGTVTWAMPPELFRNLDLRFPEVMLESISSQPDFEKWRNVYDSIAIGPGLGQDDNTANFLSSCLKALPQPRVLDADALNLLAKHRNLLKLLKGSLITPHAKEMARLLEIPIAEILKDRIGAARKFSKKYGVTVLLKGYRSLVVTPLGKTYYNATGGPNLATGGSGDVLTGLIAGLLAQGLSIENAAVCGMYVHGAAGDRLRQSHGDRGSLASEIANSIPAVIRDILSCPKDS